MNHRGHWTGGLIAAGVSGALALLLIDYGLEDFQLSKAIEEPFESRLNLILLYPGITLFMALFPDLDTASLAQRWYYRFALVAVLLLYYHEQHLILFLFAFFSFLPLLHQHRGWTHSLYTPWLLSLLMALFFEIHRAERSWFYGFSLKNSLLFLLDYQSLAYAAALGHYTHLFLDSKYVRWLGLSKNPKGHH